MVVDKDVVVVAKKVRSDRGPILCTKIYVTLIFKPSDWLSCKTNQSTQKQRSINVLRNISG